MRKLLLTKTAGLLLFVSITSVLSAQIVNIEDKRQNFDSTGWYARLDFGGDLTQNNQRVVALSGSLRADRVGEMSDNLFLFNYNLVRAGDAPFIDDGFGHLRHGHHLSERWTWEAFGQLQYNRRLSIGLRSLLGTGPRFQISEKENWDLAVGMLYMYEYNELNTETIVYRRDNRLSVYFSGKWQASKQLTISSTSYYQPLLNNLRESRLSSVNSMILSISERFAFTSSISITYDNLLARLTEGVPQTSYKWQNGLRVTF